MPEKKFDIDFGTDGVARSIYDDKLNVYAKEIGEVAQVCRLSHVEWEEVGGEKGWTIRAAHDPELAIRDVGSSEPVLICSRDPKQRIAVFTNRDVAIAVEKNHYDELMPPKEKK